MIYIQASLGLLNTIVTMNKPPSSLLLLPPPLNISYSILKATYNNTLSLVLSSISEIASKSQSTAVLEIAVPCPDYCLLWESQRLVYDQTQKLLAGLYSLISFICVRDSINTEGKGSIDARILLIEYSRDYSYVGNKGLLPSKPLQGPIIDLAGLALSQRAWQHVFSIRSLEGKILLEQFLHCTYSLNTARPLWEITEVDPGISITLPTEGLEDIQLHKYSGEAHYSVAVGGTFDHLHAGHKLLLTMATSLLSLPIQSDQRRRLVVGITQDELLKNKNYADFLESWDVRQQNVFTFLLAILDFSPQGATPPDVYRGSRPGSNGYTVSIKLDLALEIECVAISDAYGPTITDMSISALVVSGETRGGGQAVNKMRKELGWPPLEVFEISVLEINQLEGNSGANEGFDNKISSTEIRRRQSEKTDQVHEIC